MQRTGSASDRRPAASTTIAVNKELVELRESGGVLALGRVLTLVIVTDDGSAIEEAIAAGERRQPRAPLPGDRGRPRPARAAPRLDAQIRVGGDAGASEVVVLRLLRPLADGSGRRRGDAAAAARRPGGRLVARRGARVPAKDPIGMLAQRRITDSLSAKNPIKAFEQRRASHTAGDTDLAWTRMTHWRGAARRRARLPPARRRHRGDRRR